MIDTTSIMTLALSAALSGLIGYERETHGKGAGLRTHMLVGIGSCLLAMLDRHLMALYPSADVGRISAQVVSGIGFLGAGTILRGKNTVKGLTTAAGVWAASAVGLSVGMGMAAIATLSTVLLIACLKSAVWVKRRPKK